VLLVAWATAIQTASADSNSVNAPATDGNGRAIRDFVLGPSDVAEIDA
jgi:hypothetical protein